VEADGFELKMKTWPQKFVFVEGSVKQSGDQKYTYDLICEEHCNSFDLEAMPKYKMAGITLRKEAFMPIVPDYLKWRDAFEAQVARTATVAADQRALDEEKIRVDAAALTDATTMFSRANKKDKLIRGGGNPGTTTSLMAELDAAMTDKESSQPRRPAVAEKPRSGKRGPQAPAGAPAASASTTALTVTGTEASSSDSSRSSSDSSSSDSSSDSSDSSSDSSDEDVPGMASIREADEENTL
jgi:hypothetical protein